MTEMETLQKKNCEDFDLQISHLHAEAGTGSVLEGHKWRYIAVR
jgi:hypothetical protein